MSSQRGQSDGNSGTDNETKLTLTTKVACFFVQNSRSPNLLKIIKFDVALIQSYFQMLSHNIKNRLRRMFNFKF